MIEILFASHNPGKVAEVHTLLSPLGIHVLKPSDLGIADDFDVPETGETFAANAELKAKGFATELERLGKLGLRSVAGGNAPLRRGPSPAGLLEAPSVMLVLADDSGLSVDALDGKPGVHSKRFAPGTEYDRNKAILKLLAATTDDSKRTAHFVTIFCLYQPQSQKTDFFEGRVDGKIAFAERGTAGFGYDSIFIPEGYTQTFGELGGEVKNSISHRARAAQKVVEFVRAELSASHK